MDRVIRAIGICLLNGGLGFIIWNIIYYKKEHAIIDPRAGWLPVADLIKVLLWSGIIIGIIVSL